MKIKFFNAERGFGFIEGADADYYFHANGYREHVWGGNGYQYVGADMPSLTTGTPVIVISRHTGPKGPIASEWALVSNKPAVAIFAVIRTDTHTSEYAADAQRKCFIAKQHKTECVVFVGSEKDCDNYADAGDKVVSVGCSI
ncbi:MAG: cold-shock protein [Candidatus Thorarchaeota archaeon]|jgi:cold shock CspA family protein